MRISTRGRYGLRAMVELARHHGAGPILMRAISEQQGIPRKYLHALLTELRQAGLVHSLRGSRGGYSLAHDPSEITARDVVHALEGRLMLVDCGESGTPCGRYETCSTRRLWEDLTRIIEERLASVTLADLARDQAAAHASGERVE
jgi:Rrf2 family protein